jgi:hypothetical protein
MVLEATKVAMDEQRAVLHRQQETLAAGVEPPSQETVPHAA